ncbi:hypothetical protein N7532_007753 [Penicillium argentinense]|uniref:C2H2-type domain-containing protein n=1 Tax=Penicillium argentinense TaxID=1131581 RepID=A0A9W9K0X9_9EURO|nr:uncharacterized protein N7532_007753 [Penicillium argentinense]KAJ5089069.1 hypothetical protein N7532_007753 [Penicillium argentinense]
MDPDEIMQLIVPRLNHSGPFKCQWKDCQYSGHFSRKAVLLRHIEAMHINPGAYDCPEPNCFRSFNRKDNLMAHSRNVHRDGGQVSAS